MYRIEGEKPEESISVVGSRGRYTSGEGKDVLLESFNLTLKAQDLITAAPLKLSHGHRYGLIGRNGIGKTTLLQQIDNRAIKGFPKHLTTLLVQQEIKGSHLGAVDLVVASDRQRDNLLKEQEELEDAIAEEPDNEEANVARTDRLVEIYAKLEEASSDEALPRAKAILSGLGFSQLMMAKPTQKLSGGWRMRVALACALFQSPDILMLDEPTNHLDLETIIWLQDYLGSYKGTVVVVSHDKEFLNAVATDIIHFFNKTLIYYPCDFESFLKVREDKKKKKMALQENLDKKRAQISDSMKKMQQAAASNKKDHKRLGQVASRKKKLNRMGLEKTEDGKKWNCQSHGARIGSININAGGWKDGERSAGAIVEPEESSIKFEFPCSEPLGVLGAVIQLKEVSFSYLRKERQKELLAEDQQKLLDLPEKERNALLLKPRGVKGFTFHGVNLSLDMTSKIAIVGKNGAGKSTLLNMIVGSAEPSFGEVYKHHNLKIGYFAQHHFDQLDLELSPLEHLNRMFKGKREQELRAHLGMFGLSGNLALQQMATLSGGQKSRVVFATVTYQQPHVLVFDEPTNHLDFQSIEALIEALQAFEGAVIFVSHNQSLIASVAKELWVVSRGTVTRFDGDFNAYRRRVLASARKG